jgi:outer membrane protein
MKKLLVLACATATISLAAAPAIADSIGGRLGVTGKIGFTVPSDSDFNSGDNHTDPGFIGGGGLIYGINNYIAVEIGVTHSVFDSDLGYFGVTDIAFGAQYRFPLNQPQLVPYLGAGLDILVSDADHGRNIDRTVGAHAIAGVDYFIMKNVALTAEAKLLVAPNADITGTAGDQGNFDPTSISTTVGVRYFFN